MNKHTIIATAFVAMAYAGYAGLFDNIKSNITEKVEQASIAANQLLKTSASDSSGVNDAELLEMMHKVYAADMKTEAGRVKWHGKLTAQLVDTNALIKVDTYLDGYVVTNNWKLVTPRSAVDALSRKLSATTNGIPAKLAAARQKRVAELNAGVSNVTVTVEVGHDMEGAK